MNTLNRRQYSIVIFVQYSILFFDICVNSFASFSRERPIDLLVLYVIQNFCLIVALTILLVNFFSTYIFQILSILCTALILLYKIQIYLYYLGIYDLYKVGLIQLLYTRFRITLILCVLYMILSISLHTWHIKIHWTDPLKHYWTKGFHVLYSLHRGVAVLYYYFYKRASLRIADPRFYEDSTWVRTQLSLP